MPDNIKQPNHQAMIDVANAPPFKQRLAKLARNPLPNVTVYYDAFCEEAQSIDIWHSEYNHVLESHAAIVEWGKGTSMRPFLDLLDDDEQHQFIQSYLKKSA